MRVSAGLLTSASKSESTASRPTRTAEQAGDLTSPDVAYP